MKPTLGTIVILLLVVAVLIWILGVMIKLTKALLSNIFVKVISLILIGCFIHEAYGAFVNTRDMSMLAAIVISVIIGIVVLSIKGEPGERGGYHGGSVNSGPSGRNARPQNVCPRCNCEYQYIPEKVVPTGEYNDYEGKGYWQYYTEDGMTKSRWIQPHHHDPVFQKIGGYWKCPKCGRRR